MTLALVLAIVSPQQYIPSAFVELVYGNDHEHVASIEVYSTCTLSHYCTMSCIPTIPESEAHHATMLTKQANNA